MNTSIHFKNVKGIEGIEEFFEKKVRPVLVKHCYDCHASDAKNIRGGLLVDTRGGIRQGGGTLDYYTVGAPSIDGTCAEMIYWERPTGGRVFHAGAIAAGWALSDDSKWRTVMRNALHHFGPKAKDA